MVDTPMELEKGLTTPKDKEPKEMSLIEKPIEKHYDRSRQDTPYIDELIEHEQILPLVINDDLPLGELSDPLKLILEPLPCSLKYTFLGDVEGIIPYEKPLHLQTKHIL